MIAHTILENAAIGVTEFCCDAGLGARPFIEVMGVTSHQYLIRMRARRAAWLLAVSDMAMTSIAFEAGFGDLSNFVRTFGRAAVASPAAFLIDPDGNNVEAV
jgi:AraC-like DNA-binding protein